MARDAGAQHIRGIICEVLEETSPVARVHDVIFYVPVVVVGGQAMEGAEKHTILVAGYLVGKIMTRALIPRPIVAAMPQRRSHETGRFRVVQPGFIVIEE